LRASKGRPLGKGFMRLLRLIVPVPIVGLVAACAGTPPVGLEPLQATSPTRRAAQSAPLRTVGAKVRWGGEIWEVTNRARNTGIAIFSRPLYDNAEPRPDGGHAVRFLAVVDRFLDPAEYLPGKRFTVVGHLAGNRKRAVGEYPYADPVVEVAHYHLWPAYSPLPDHRHWQDPFYDPWRPWGLWGPYRRW
jgi:outer membrane lipoprotein